MSALFQFLSQNADSANALAVIASAITAVLAFTVSIVAVVVARATLKHQRRHDILSVRPFPTISLGDYENKLVVWLENHGAGPMIVRTMAATRGDEKRAALIDLMPDLEHGFSWTTFVAAIDGRAIVPGDDLTLLEFDGDPSDGQFAEARDAVRLALASVCVTVEYTDMYESTTSTVSRKLDWFGRNVGFEPEPIDNAKEGRSPKGRS